MLFNMQSDPFQTFGDWPSALRNAQSAPNQTVWAIVNFDSLPMYFVVLSRPTPAGSVHAEEAVIENFMAFLGRATARKRSLLKECHIFLSDSPCTVADPRASHSLKGWPLSCFKKFCALAKLYRALELQVFYARNYGEMDGFTSKPHLGRTIFNLLKRTGIFSQVIDTMTPGQLDVTCRLTRSALSDFFPAAAADFFSDDRIGKVLRTLNKLGLTDAGFRKLLSDPGADVGAIVAKTVLSALTQPNKPNAMNDSKVRDTYLSEVQQGNQNLVKLDASLRTDLSARIFRRAIDPLVEVNRQWEGAPQNLSILPWNPADGPGG